MATLTIILPPEAVAVAGCDLPSPHLLPKAAARTRDTCTCSCTVHMHLHLHVQRARAHMHALVHLEEQLLSFKAVELQGMHTPLMRGTCTHAHPHAYD